MIKHLTIDDDTYKLDIPDSYMTHGRLTYVNNRPGIYATDLDGKSRFFRAKKIYQRKVK